MCDVRASVVSNAICVNMLKRIHICMKDVDLLSVYTGSHLAYSLTFPRSPLPLIRI